MNGGGLRDLQNNIKNTNMCIGIMEEECEKNGKKSFKIIRKNLMKDVKNLYVVNYATLLTEMAEILN